VTSADSTTIVAVAVLDGAMIGAWVGDSRIYRVRGSAVTRMTTDHSWAEGVVSRGLMTADQAAADPRAHVIMRWLGPPEDRELGVDTFHTPVAAGDVVLCCTDGLYMYFAPPYGTEEEIGQVISQSPHLGAALDTLVAMALRRGGYDNITVAGLRVPDSRTSDRMTDEVPIVGP
jgi:protein phosphatase